VVRPAATVVAVAGLALHAMASLQGVINVWQNRHDLVTAAQWGASVSQLAYAVLSGVVIASWLRRSPRTRAWIVAWGLCFTVAVGLIPAAWVPEDVGSTWRVLAMGLGGALVIGATLWWPRHERPDRTGR
jgi:hypothetical protein